MAFDAVEVQSADSSKGQAPLPGERHDVPSAIITTLSALDKPIAYKSIDKSGGTAAAEPTSLGDLRPSRHRRQT